MGKSLMKLCGPEIQNSFEWSIDFDEFSLPLFAGDYVTLPATVKITNPNILENIKGMSFGLSLSSLEVDNFKTGDVYTYQVFDPKVTQIEFDLDIRFHKGTYGYFILNNPTFMMYKPGQLPMSCYFLSPERFNFVHNETEIKDMQAPKLKSVSFNSGDRVSLNLIISDRSKLKTYDSEKMHIELKHIQTDKIYHCFFREVTLKDDGYLVRLDGDAEKVELPTGKYQLRGVSLSDELGNTSHKVNSKIHFVMRVRCGGDAVNLMNRFFPCYFVCIMCIKSVGY